MFTRKIYNHDKVPRLKKYDLPSIYLAWLQNRINQTSVSLKN